MTDPQFTAGICSVALPLIAGVHRFAVDYGYRGLDRDRARDNALEVGAIVFAICAALYIWKWW